MRRWIPVMMLLLLAGCFPPQPPVDPNFMPTRRFQAGYDQVWTAVEQALAVEGAPVVATDRPAGHITSGPRPLHGWVPGEEPGEENDARVTYQVSLVRTERGTLVTVSLLIEVMTHRYFKLSDWGTVPWHDVTPQNPGLAQALTRELFGAIQAKLPPQSGVSQSEA